MRKVEIDKLTEFMIENVSKHIIVSYDCRFEDSEIEFAAFDEKSTCETYAEQNAREIVTIINFDLYDRGYDDDDEIVYEDAISILENGHYIEEIEESGAEVIY